MTSTLKSFRFDNLTRLAIDLPRSHLCSAPTSKDIDIRYPFFPIITAIARR